MVEAGRAEFESRVQGIKSQIILSLDEGRVSDDLWALTDIPRDPRLDRIYSTTSELQLLFQSYDPLTQLLFSEAVLESVRDWRSYLDKPGTLAQLTHLAADTYTLKATPNIVDMVEEELIQRRDSEDFMNPLRAAIGALSYFAIKGHDDKVKQSLGKVFRKWFYDPNYERFSASLMNILSHMSPHDFPRYLPRVINVAERNPALFDMNAVLNELIRVSTSTVIRQHLGRLPRRARDLIDERLRENSKFS